MNLNELREKTLNQIDTQQELRAQYDERPFRKQFEEVQARLDNLIMNKIDNSEDLPITLAVSEEDFRLIWLETNAILKLMGEDPKPYDRKAKYALHGIVIVKLELPNEEKVKEYIEPHLAHYRRLLKFQPFSLVKDCLLTDVNNTITALEKLEEPTSEIQKEIEFYKNVKSTIQNSI